jgi:hypothetical protein
MLRRLAPCLPLLLVLGCGASPPAASPEQPADGSPPPSGSAASGTSPAAATPPSSGAQPAAAAAETKPASPSAQGGAASGKDTVNRAVASDAPISTGITQPEILALVNQNVDTFYRCYTPPAGAPKGFRPKVTVKATVGPTGAVNTVEVVDSNTKSPKVDACVVAGFKKLVFTRPAGSGATVFTFPMTFGEMEQVK